MRHKNFYRLSVLMLIWDTFSFTQSLYSQETTQLLTDRPGQAESTTIIPPGSLQVETGITFTSDTRGLDQDIDKQQTLAVGTTLVCIGLLKNLELRLIGQHSQSQTFLEGINKTNSESGLSDIAIGGKFGIREEDALIPEIALNLHMGLPVGGENFRPSVAVPDFRLLLAKTLTEDLSLGLNLGAEYSGDKPDGTFVYTLSLAMGLTDKLGAYIETYGDMPSTEKLNVLVDGGFTYLVAPLVQLDLEAGYSLSERTSLDYFIAGGVSFRLFK